MEFSPSQCCMYTLPGHAMNAANIAGSKVDGHSRREDTDVAIDVQRFSRIKIKLTLKEPVNKIFKMWNLGVFRNNRRWCSVICWLVSIHI